MHAGLVDKLRRFANEEFEMILAERKVVERLNGLDEVVKEGRRRKDRGEMVDGEVPVP